MKLILFIIFLFFKIQLHKAKTFKGSFPLELFNRYHWEPLIKFGISKNPIKIFIEAKLKHKVLYHSEAPITININLNVFLDKQWNKIRFLDDNCDKSHNSLAISNFSINIPSNGDWSLEHNFTINPLNNNKSSILIFVLSDCNYIFPEFSEITNEIVIYLHITDINDNHLSNELFINYYSYLLLTPLIIFYSFLQIINLYADKYKKKKYVSFIHLLRLISLIFEAFSIGFEFLNLHLLKNQGEEIEAIWIFQQIFAIISQNLIIFIIIELLWGWTILSNSIENQDLIIKLALVLTGLQIIGLLTELGFGNFHETKVFYDYEGFSGYVIIVSRIFAFIYFLWNFRNVIENEYFSYIFWPLFKWAIYYFTIFPICICFIEFFEEFYMKTFISLFLRATQIFFLFKFKYFIDEKSAYYSISSKIK